MSTTPKSHHHHHHDHHGFQMMTMSSDGSSPEQHEKGNFAITGGRSSDRGGGGIINNLDRLSVVDTRQSSITEYRLYKRRWLGLSALMGMNMVISWGWLTFAPVSTFAQQYYGLESKTPINWLSTVIFFTYIVASPIVTYILNRHGIKLAITISSLLTVVGFWVRYIGTRLGPDGHGTFGVVMLGQILIGFAQPFVLSSPTYYSDAWFTSRGRVTATALASLSNPFGAAIGQLVNPFLATKAEHIPNMVLYIAIIATIPSILSLLIPSAPPNPPCASATLKKLPLTAGLNNVFKNKEFLVIFVLFSTYLGLFNAFSSLINQIMEPYGYSADEAGYTGAALIVVGLIASAIISPLIDRTHAFTLSIRLQVPLIAACYIALIWAPTTGSAPTLPGPMIVCAVLGAASFSLLPLSLEYAVERTHPVSPEVSSTMLWMGGQALGGVFLNVMDALRRDKEVNGRMIYGDMSRALIFQGVVAGVVAPAVLLMSGRKGDGGNRRVEADRTMVLEPRV